MGCFRSVKDNSVPAIWLKGKRNREVSPSARIKASIVMRNDSPRNCQISWRRWAPTTLRRPTSFVRVVERAVERFIKFRHPMSKIRKAMMEYM